MLILFDSKERKKELIFHLEKYLFCNEMQNCQKRLNLLNLAFSLYVLINLIQKGNFLRESFTSCLLLNEEFIN